MDAGDTLRILGSLIALGAFIWLFWRLFALLFRAMRPRRRAAAGHTSRAAGRYTAGSPQRTLDERLAYIPRPIADTHIADDHADAGVAVPGQRSVPDQRTVLRQQVVVVLKARQVALQEAQAQHVALVRTLRAVERERFLAALDEHPATASRISHDPQHPAR